MLRRFKVLVKNRHFWVVVALFALCTLLHYPRQILGVSSPSLFSFLGLSRHAVERIFLLLPVSYAGFYLGITSGFISVAMSAVIMLPRVFFISEYFPDAMFETIIVIIIGFCINLWFAYYRKEKTQRQIMLDNIEEANRQLQEHARQLEETQQQLKESQEQVIQVEKLKSLGQLAASIAHEVNNPLSGILVYTQLLSKNIGSGKSNNQTNLNYLSKMEAELIRSTKLVRDLLDFSRQSPLELQEAEINEIVRRALDLMQVSARMQNIDVTSELAPSLPKIPADANQLQQVFMNLMMNAIQAMPEGGKLTIRTSRKDAHVRFEVKDTGVGIPPENMSKLFTPFFSTRKEIKGVGLGLAVAYGIVERHNGKIEVASAVGKGSTFTVSLPVAQ